jgi:hypothetical protein
MNPLLIPLVTVIVLLIMETKRANRWKKLYMSDPQPTSTP